MGGGDRGGDITANSCTGEKALIYIIDVINLIELLVTLTFKSVAYSVLIDVHTIIKRSKGCCFFF